jgi:glutamine synthetase
MESDKDYILKMAREKNVRFIRLWFTDILGILKSFAVNIDELEDAMNEGIRFDGSTLNGFIRSDEHELIAIPDPETFQILPWRPQDDGVARMFCDIYNTDMTPFEGDSRYILKRTLQKAHEKGYIFYTGPEIEFFFFKNNEKPETLDKGGYFDLTPLDTAADYRRHTVLTLQKMGIDTISSHHEGAHSQHEIDLRHEDALTTAENIMTFRVVAKEIAQKNNIFASFMPKPMSEQNGSGMHIHMSLFKDDKNMFFDENHELYLSSIAKHFVAGLIKHAPEYFAVTNQWINSYKRFHQGFEAPVNLSWSRYKPTSMIRVPECKKSKQNSMRVELRNPDPSCNPYLALSVILAAGLKGIEEKYELGESFDAVDVSKNSFQSLPADLSEALIHFEKSDLMTQTLGSTVKKLFLENKYYELNKFNRYVTDFEINHYFPIL